MSHSNYQQKLFESYEKVSERLGREKPKQFVYVRPAMTINLKDQPPPLKRIKNPAYRTKNQLVIDEILAQKNLEWDEVFNDHRYRLPSLVRNEIWWTLKQCGLTYNQIGRICRPHDPYNHTSILHGVRRHQRVLDEQNAVTVESTNSSNNAGWESDGDWVD